MNVHAALEEPKRIATAPMRLLIVDDEETTRELCVAVAQQAGLKATAVASAGCRTATVTFATQAT